MAPAPPPELVDDAVAKILLRVPPSDPAILARASLVCKRWRRVVADPSFPRRYRAFHHRSPPPLLGLLRSSHHHTRKSGGTAMFVPKHTRPSSSQRSDASHSSAATAASSSTR
ncbi:unnamed protein product [Urochloa humidicola]